MLNYLYLSFVQLPFLFFKGHLYILLGRLFIKVGLDVEQTSEVRVLFMELLNDGISLCIYGLLLVD